MLLTIGLMNTIQNNNMNENLFTSTKFEEIGTALKEILRRMSEIQAINDLNEMRETELLLKNLQTISTKENELPNSLSNQLLEDDIKALKKRIKYAKTPMERKEYEKQLNSAYKERKKKKIER